MSQKDDLISRQEIRKAMYHEAMEKDSDEQKWDSGCWIRYKMFERVLETLPSAQPEQDMVDDLISFIEREKDKENRTLADWTVQWILESIIDGDCKITGSATDHEEKKMYVEFSFYQEEHDG